MDGLTYVFIAIGILYFFSLLLSILLIMKIFKIPPTTSVIITISLVCLVLTWIILSSSLAYILSFRFLVIYFLVSLILYIISVLAFPSRTPAEQERRERAREKARENDSFPQ